MINIKKTIMIFVIAVTMGLFVLTKAQAEILFNENIPIDGFLLFSYDCPEPEEDEGEWVVLEGAVHLLIQGKMTPRAHLGIHLNAQGISGVGQTTGLQYQGNGAANLTINADDLDPLIVTAVVNANLISHGPDDNRKLKIRIHITINANGEITAVVKDIEAECV